MVVVTTNTSERLRLLPALPFLDRKSVLSQLAGYDFFSARFPILHVNSIAFFAYRLVCYVVLSRLKKSKWYKNKPTLYGLPFFDFRTSSSRMSHPALWAWSNNSIHVFTVFMKTYVYADLMLPSAAACFFSCPLLNF